MPDWQEARAVIGPCGHEVEGTDVMQLYANLKTHMASEHPDENFTDEQIREWIDERSFNNEPDIWETAGG